jgi:hypothetical protein
MSDATGKLIRSATLPYEMARTAPPSLYARVRASPCGRSREGVA